MMNKNTIKKEDAKGHEDQNDRDETRLLVSQVIIWDISVYRVICLKEVMVKGAKSQVLNPRCGKQWLLGFSWKIMPQVVLERAAL